jgi:hypothetical protein
MFPWLAGWALGAIDPAHAESKLTQANLAYNFDWL